jgi:hypothetical protein
MYALLSKKLVESNAISDSKIIFIFYQILMKENLSPNLESATIN